MAFKTHNTRTRRFITYWPYVAFIAVLVMVIALLHAWTSGKGQLLQSLTLKVSEDELQKLPPIPLQREPIGALRIDVVAQIPNNQWVTYEIQVLDAQNQVLAAGIKQAWKESGSWSEDGESGSWAEDDLQSGLDVRATQPETVTIALQVLEYSNTAGQEIDQPVSFSVVVRNGVVDYRYLIAGFVGTVAIATLSYLGVSHSGKLVLSKGKKDSFVEGRAVVGGTNRLVKVKVNIESDKRSPKELVVELTINNRSGEILYQQPHTVRVRFMRNNSGSIEKAKASLSLFFLLDVHSSYGFAAQVVPDASVDKTFLYVREGARTLGAVPVVPIGT